MKKYTYKMGFSLAEVLISLTIIGIISVMVTSAAKRGIARAYNNYFYTGYDTLETVLLDTSKKKFSDYINIVNEADDSSTKLDNNSFQNNSPFVKAVNSLFERHAGVSVNDNKIIIEHHNGVTYTISKSADNKYYVEMEVPAAKSQGSRRKTKFLYNQDDNIGLIPISGPDNTYIDISTRVDLLPCIVYTHGPEQARAVRNTYNFKTAYCFLNNNYPNSNCNNINRAGISGNRMKVVSPK